MNPPHHSKGSEFPPLEKDVLRLYSMKYCPFGQAARLVLEHKQIPYELIHVNTKNRPDWFLERTPFGLVPVLEQNDNIVYDSIVCDNYLDEVYDNKKLLPRDPYERAKIGLLMNRANHTMDVFIGIFISSEDQEKRDEKYKQFLADLTALETELRDLYFGGDDIGMMDLYLWPVVERMAIIDDITQKETINSTSFPKLQAWAVRMRDCPAVKATIQDIEKHRRFLTAYFTNSPIFDF